MELTEFFETLEKAVAAYAKESERYYKLKYKIIVNREAIVKMLIEHFDVEDIAETIIEAEIRENFKNPRRLAEI